MRIVLYTRVNYNAFYAYIIVFVVAGLVMRICMYLYIYIHKYNTRFIVGTLKIFGNFIFKTIVRVRVCVCIHLF